MFVAVYGSLKRAFHNHHHYLQNSDFVGNDTVSGFDMYSLGGFPGIVPNSEAESPVSVEIYDVNRATLERLDRLEGHPHFYERVLVFTDTGKQVNIYVYKGDTDDLYRVKSGCWEAGTRINPL